MNPVQHFEIPYKVQPRAKKFYFEAFGWQLFDVPGTGYSFATTVPIHKNGMPTKAGAINGGLTPRSKDLQAPTLLIHVGDVHAHLARIEDAGGSIVVPPTPMGPVTYARVRDTEGNVIGIIEDRAEGQERPAARGKAKAAKKAAKPAKAKPAKRGKASRKKR
jgi:uncharacterized protein